MKKLKLLSTIIILSIFCLTPITVFSSNTKPCSKTSKITGKIYKVIGSDINVRKGPGVNFSKIINKKATQIIQETIYVTIDDTVKVFEECSEGKWSKIYVSEPSYLRDSHRGWVASKFLRNKKVDKSGTEVFTETDFLFDKKTRPHKKIIISGVNKIHRENPRCKQINTSSAYISSSKGSKSNPVFFVTCGKGSKSFNVFFSKSDIINNKKFTAKKQMSESKAIELCEKYAKSQATHPSTLSFSKIMNLSIYQTPNGRTKVTSTFTIKNSFNLTLKHNITCLFDDTGLIEGNISESK